MFLAIILLFAGAFQGVSQQQAGPSTPKGTTPTPKPQATSTAPQTNQKATTPAKPGTPNRPFRVSVKDNFGSPVVSLQAKKAKRSEVAAEIGRLLKVPVIVGGSLKEELLTLDLEDFPLDAAMKRLAPRPVIDYMIIGGGDSTRPAKKRALAIYLLGPGDKAPADGPWNENKSGGQMMVGWVYETEEEEKAALEKKKNELQVTYNEGLFTLNVYQQFLTDVLQEVAAQAHIPFAILTRNGAQKEIDQVVTWNVSGVGFEELTNTWFPNGVRLYWRTDLATDVSKPLRLTIEDREEEKTDAQAVQNVTP